MKINPGTVLRFLPGAVAGGVLAGELGATAESGHPLRDIALGAGAGGTANWLLLKNRPVASGIREARSLLGWAALLGLTGLGGLGLAHVTARRHAGRKMSGRDEDRLTAIRDIARSVRELRTPRTPPLPGPGFSIFRLSRTG